MRLTSILGEQHILSFQISVDDLIAVKENQTADDVQCNQVALAAGQHHTISTQCRQRRKEKEKTPPCGSNVARSQAFQ